MAEKILRVLDDLKREIKSVEGPVAALDGMETCFADKADIVKVLQFLKKTAEGSFDMLTDLTAVDWLPKPDKGYRFEVVYHLCSSVLNHRIRVKVKVSEEEPSLPTVSGIYQAANWMEREVYDLFGVTFDGHPDLRRILLWEGYEGYPLRKDYPTRGLHPPERTPYL